MERSITDKEKELIINFGAFSYEPQKMAAILGWPVSEVFQLMKAKDSAFHELYSQGRHKADYVIDLKLFEMAQGGDMKALYQFEKRVKKEDDDV